MNRRRPYHLVSIALTFALVLSSVSLLFPTTTSAALLSSNEAQAAAQKLIVSNVMMGCAAVLKDKVPSDKMNDMGWYIDTNRTSNTYPPATDKLVAWLGTGAGERDAECNVLIWKFYDIVGRDAYGDGPDPQWNFMKGLGYTMSNDKTQVIKPSNIVQNIANKYTNGATMDPTVGYSPNFVMNSSLQPESKYWLTLSYITQVCGTPSTTKPTSDALFVRELRTFSSDGTAGVQYVGCDSQEKDREISPWIDALSRATTAYISKYNKEVLLPAQAKVFAAAICPPVAEGLPSGQANYENSDRNACLSAAEGAYRECMQTNEYGVVDKTYAINCLSQKTGKSPAEVRDALMAAEEASRPAAEVPVVTGSGPGNTYEDDSVTCTSEIGPIGWIVCPTMNFLATISDGLYSFISNQLAIPPEMLATTGDNSQTYESWKVFRNYANILFIIAFLAIVYSQLTGAGINNYGIKKMLPKLIIAAILVNLSFVICQLAVDLSNILGFGIKSLFDSMGAGIPTGEEGGGWRSAIGTILAGGALVVGTIALLLAVSVPTLIAAVLALASAALILISQKALVILLIVVSPVAFVLYLLPNTESIFKKWLSLFKSLLLLFPIISLLFGAGGLAAKILGNMDHVGMQIAALAATALPLFAIFPVLQSALKGTGVIGEKIGGLSRRANAQVGNRIKNESRLGEAQRAFAARRSQKRADRRLRSPIQKAIDRSAVGRFIGGERGAASAIAAQQKATREQIDNQVALLENENPSVKLDRAESMLRAANKSKDTVSARAAAQVLRNGGAKGKDMLHSTIVDMEENGGIDKTVADGIKADNLSAGVKGYDAALDMWSTDAAGNKLSAWSTSSSVDVFERDDNGEIVRDAEGKPVKVKQANGAATRLNQSELGGQSFKRLKEYIDGNLITTSQAQAALSSYEKGTLPLDEAKVNLLKEFVASRPAAEVQAATGAPDTGAAQEPAVATPDSGAQELAIDHSNTPSTQEPAPTIGLDTSGQMPSDASSYLPGGRNFGR